MSRPEARGLFRQDQKIGKGREGIGIKVAEAEILAFAKEQQETGVSVHVVKGVVDDGSGKTRRFWEVTVPSDDKRFPGVKYSRVDFDTDGRMTHAFTSEFGMGGGSFDIIAPNFHSLPFRQRVKVLLDAAMPYPDYTRGEKQGTFDTKQGLVTWEKII